MSLSKKKNTLHLQMLCNLYYVAFPILQLFTDLSVIIPFYNMVRAENLAYEQI